MTGPLSARERALVRATVRHVLALLAERDPSALSGELAGVDLEPEDLEPEDVEELRLLLIVPAPSEDARAQGDPSLHAAPASQSAPVSISGDPINMNTQQPPYTSPHPQQSAFNPYPQPGGVDACGRPLPPQIDPRLIEASDKLFFSAHTEANKIVRVTETELVSLSWGPRIDVTFHPKGAPGIVGGRVRLIGRTRGCDFEIASVNIASADTPVTFSGGFGCHSYVITASAGVDPGPTARAVESYVFARVYAR